jgi:hypothetical protein
MTTIAIDGMDLANVLAQVQDARALAVVSRVIESQITVAEAQLVQLRQVHEALQARIKPQS